LDGVFVQWDADGDTILSGYHFQGG
jgi:hypothetical protein